MAEPSMQEWLARLDRGELSAQELVTHVLSRIEATHAAVNAAVAIDGDRALAEAKRADRRRDEGDRSPLLGIPLTIKDSLATAGLATTCGSVARAAVVPDRDATVVARLRAAGAIVVAKSNVPEYQWRYETANALHGRTLNPLDPERTPGGSSGGEAALLGADASIAGVGTDGGGSIRVPSHYCGTVGLRPTVGATPETGVWPPTRATGMLGLLCVGPMARYVEDLWPLLSVMAGADGIDPFALPASIADDDGSGRRLRVGWYVEDGVLEPSDETRAAVTAACAALADRGHEVVAAPPPNVGEATDLFFKMMAADGGERARVDLTSAGEPVAPEMAALLDRLQAHTLSAGEYFELLERAFALRARVQAYVARHDVIVCPVTSGPAPPHGVRPSGTTGAEWFNACHTIALAGLPSAVVPVGEQDGLPLGVQVVAGAFRDRLALGVAAILEEALGGFAAVGARA